MRIKNVKFHHKQHPAILRTFVQVPGAFDSVEIELLGPGGLIGVVEVGMAEGGGIWLNSDDQAQTHRIEPN